jgi:Glycoside hydrolase family 5 C-terminal domain/Cellulase (glycosyl hydrolase family 5)
MACQNVTIPAAFIPDDSGGTAADSHRIPLSPERTARLLHTSIVLDRQGRLSCAHEDGIVIVASGPCFVDEHGRALMLRGVNLGGSSKVPRVPNGATHERGGLADHRHVSFIGRPFPLAEADEHFERLREWGLTFLRFLVTWEAVEHAGPGIYDQEFLDYLRAVVAKADDHGITVLIDPHQDVWSRWCGGDGAPGWTLEAAGFDLSRLDETGAAVTHQVIGDPLPSMIWPTNSGKLAAATMFTLFFGGNDFAPRQKVDGQPMQDYLQSHFIQAFCVVAQRLKDLPNVAGYDAMNEPLPGYIGWKDLNAAGGIVTLGDCPTPFQGMLLGAGIPQQVEVRRLGFTRIRRVGSRRLNPGGVRAWRAGQECIWRQNGVWDVDGPGNPVLLRPDHFTLRPDGRMVDFADDYYRPFARSFASAIRKVDPRALIFLEAEANRTPPRWSLEDGRNAVFAPHWYDDLVLARRRFSPWMAVDSARMKVVFGRRAVRRSFHEQLARLSRAAVRRAGGIPVLLAEFGAPFNLNGSKAYRTGDFRVQERVLDRSFRAIEENLLSCAIWNYCADNTNARGDLWNGEDLSIFSRDQRSNPADINSGGRALRALVRPYPRATAGELLRMRFDMKTRTFEMAFRADPRASAVTEIFVPRLHYPGGPSVEVSDGSFEHRHESQVLEYHHGAGRTEHWLRLKPKEQE